jgi:phosphoglycerate dehydrogenase-like enzyme
MNQDKGIILVAMAPGKISLDALEALREAGGGREVRRISDTVEMEPVLDTVEIAIGNVPFALIPRMPRLKWVQLWSAGADLIQQWPEVKKLPFQLTSTSGIHGPQMTEHLFGMLLAWNRCFPEVFAAQKRHEWLRIGPRRLSILTGKTMLILGYGSIGKTVARAAEVFGMRVIGIRRHDPAVGKETDGAAPNGPNVTVAGLSRLAELLPQADHVVNILPWTPDTRHCFGADQFRAMKKTALYINIGRGPTTDEAALIKALQSGEIAGALLDVMETEPLPADSPLWDMDKVILSGHYAGFHPDTNGLAMEIVLDNLGRYIRGEALKNLVDKDLGY